MESKIKEYIKSHQGQVIKNVSTGRNIKIGLVRKHTKIAVRALLVAKELKENEALKKDIKKGPYSYKVSMLYSVNKPVNRNNRGNRRNFNTITVRGQEYYLRDDPYYFIFNRKAKSMFFDDITKFTDEHYNSKIPYFIMNYTSGVDAILLENEKRMDTKAKLNVFQRRQYRANTNGIVSKFMDIVRG